MIPWLLALLFGAALSGGSASRRVGARPLDESRLTTAERAELRRLEQSRSLAQQNVETANAKLSRLAPKLTEAAGEIRRGVVMVLLWAIGLGVFSFIAFIQAGPGVGKIFTLVVLGAVWIGYFVASAMYMKDKLNERDEVLAHIAGCQTGISKAESLAQEGMRMIEDTWSRLHSAVKARERGREEEQQQLVRAQHELTTARTMQALLTARQEAERREHDAALVRAATSQRGELGAFLKSALAHWKTVAKRPNAFVAIHADRIVADEDRIMAAYADTTLPGFTADDCARLAADALREFPGEVAFGLPNPADRTIDKLAYILRRYVGDAREVLLPKAQRLVYERSHSAGGSTAPNPQLVPPRPLSNRVAAALKTLPPGISDEVEQKIRDAITLADFAVLKRKVLAEQRAKLGRQRIDAADLDHEMDILAANLDLVDREWALARRMTHHAAF